MIECLCLFNESNSSFVVRFTNHSLWLHIQSSTLYASCSRCRWRLFKWDVPYHFHQSTTYYLRFFVQGKLQPRVSYASAPQKSSMPCFSTNKSFSSVAGCTFLTSWPFLFKDETRKSYLITTGKTIPWLLTQQMYSVISLTKETNQTFSYSSVSSWRLWLWKVEICNGSNGTTRFEHSTGI
jgi:hypothetical protein